MEEYRSLRDEINQKVSLQNTLIIFLYTASLSLITLSFSENIPILCLAPICIILPIVRRIMYYRFSIMKISSYLIIFYEEKDTGIYWETAQNTIPDVNLNQTFLKYYEPLLTQIICIVLYCISCDFKSWVSIFYVFCAIISTFYLMVCTIRINSMLNLKSNLIEQYKQLKETNC